MGNSDSFHMSNSSHPSKNIHFDSIELYNAQNQN